jgi:hypothetical protein
VDIREISGVTVLADEADDLIGDITVHLQQGIDVFELDAQGRVVNQTVRLRPWPTGIVDTPGRPKGSEVRRCRGAGGALPGSLRASKSRHRTPGTLYA